MWTAHGIFPTAGALNLNLLLLLELKFKNRVYIVVVVVVVGRKLSDSNAILDVLSIIDPISAVMLTGSFPVPLGQILECL